MNADFNPGEGWREVNSDAYWEKKTGKFVKYDDNDAGMTRYWVRDEPVSPLPTEPYTVIQVTWKNRFDGCDVLWLAGGGRWQILADAYVPDDLVREITDFQVLARPVGKVLAEDEDTYYDSDDVAAIKESVRRETAKEVLTAVRDQSPYQTWDFHMKMVARQFEIDA